MLPSTPPAQRLDEDEVRVTRAHRLLIGLGAALVHKPFDTATHEQLRTFLRDDIDPVLVSLHALQARPDADLRARIDDLAGHRLSLLGGVA